MIRHIVIQGLRSKRNENEQREEGIHNVGGKN
jgi:hypothetical protein